MIDLIKFYVCMEALWLMADVPSLRSMTVYLVWFG